MDLVPDQTTNLKNWDVYWLYCFRPGMVNTFFWSQLTCCHSEPFKSRILACISHFISTARMFWCVLRCSACFFMLYYLYQASKLIHHLVHSIFYKPFKNDREVQRMVERSALWGEEVLGTACIGANIIWGPSQKTERLVSEMECRELCQTSLCRSLHVE